jgi:cytochrome P450
MYRLHHSSKYWGDDVEEYIPERWLNPERIPKDCFLPFSAGTRNCIGQNFAMMVIRIIVVTLIRRYKFEDIPNQDMDIVHFLTPNLKTKQYNVKIYSRN